MTIPYDKQILDFFVRFEPTLNADTFSFTTNLTTCLQLLNKMEVLQKDFFELLVDLEKLAKQKNITNSIDFLWTVFNRVFIKFWAKDVFLVNNHKNTQVAAIVAYYFLAVKTKKLTRKRYAKAVAKLFLVDAEEIVKIAKELEPQLTVFQKLGIEEFERVDLQNHRISKDMWEMYSKSTDNLLSARQYILKKRSSLNV